MFLFSLFQSNYGLIIGVTVGAIIVLAVIVVGVMLLVRRRNMNEDKLGERRSSNPNREEFSFENNVCYVMSGDTKEAME